MDYLNLKGESVILELNFSVQKVFPVFVSVLLLLLLYYMRYFILNTCFVNYVKWITIIRSYTLREESCQTYVILQY